MECPDNQMNIVPTCGNFDPENHTSTLGVIATAIWSLPGELYALDISKPPMLLPHVLPNLNMPTIRAFGNSSGIKNPIMPCLWVRKTLHYNSPLPNPTPQPFLLYPHLARNFYWIKMFTFCKEGSFHTDDVDWIFREMGNPCEPWSSTMTLVWRVLPGGVSLQGQAFAWGNPSTW